MKEKEVKNEARSEYQEALIQNKSEKMVRLGNFVVMKDEYYISVFNVSRTWYVGYAPGTMIYEFFLSSFWGKEELTDETVDAAVMLLTSIYAGSTIMNADFTRGLLDLVQKLPAWSDTDEGKTDEEIEKENAETLERLQKLHEVEEALASSGDKEPEQSEEREDFE